MQLQLLFWTFLIHYWLNVEPTDTDGQFYLSNGTVPSYKPWTTNLTKRISQITKLFEYNAKCQYRFLCCSSEQFSSTACELEGLPTTPRCPIIVHLTEGRASLPVCWTHGYWWPRLAPCTYTCSRDRTPRAQHRHVAAGEQDAAGLPFSHQQAPLFFSVWALEFQIKCPSPTAKKRSN